VPGSLSSNSGIAVIPYRGRFAPSPTGPLQLGSLIAALASYLDARNNKGTWLVRIDDLDPPREIAGAARSILQALKHHGLHWDEDVLWQSNRGAAYEHALSRLENTGATFACNCSRGNLGPNGSCQGPCRNSKTPLTGPTSTRIAVPESCTIVIPDKVQGLQHIALGHSSSNFLIHRKDGLYAYQLAVVVDDAFQKITHSVRGSDLLGTTARQIFLQQSLGYSTPTYSHIPVITNAQGHKFSKQSHAPALSLESPAANLRTALQFLGQPQPPGEFNCPAAILNYAGDHWAVNLVPAVMSMPSAPEITAP